jgi:CheY-like chemotaxis protein
MPRPGKAVLVVEEDAQLRASIASAIKRMGVEVLVACDGTQALALLSSGACPAAVLVDLAASDVEGQRFLDAVRGLPALETVPVITMTGGPPPARSVATHCAEPFDVREIADLLVSLC